MTPFRTLSGVAAPFMVDDIDTDQIVPSAYLRRMNADLAEGLFAYLRRDRAGKPNTDFVLEKPQYKAAKILVVGQNFGCGSSREHAAWAMAAFGIRCIVARSHAEYFRENCLRNGILAVSLSRATMDDFVATVTRVDGAAPFSVDLETQTISGPNGGQTWTFAIAPFEKIALMEGLDETGLTLKHDVEIGAWERRIAAERPFLQTFRLNR